MAVDDKALTRALDARGERTSLWTGLAVGLGVAALLGIAGVAVYLVMRSKQMTGPQLHGSAQPSVYLIDNTRSGTAIQPAPAALIPQQAKSLPRQRTASMMKSYRLPSLSDADSRAARIATAPRHAGVEVVLRVASPPNSWAVFSNDANELNTPGIGTVPVGNTFIIPMGQHDRVYLEPGQAIFAKGNMANVIVSVSISDGDLA